MRFLDSIKTTVGQVVKDLKAIAKGHPDALLSYTFYYDYSTENHITGTRVLRNVILLLR